MEKIVHHQGKRVFYRKDGEGPPVLLVHGFGETGSIWNHQVEDLKKQFTLLIPDLPGSGESEHTGDLSMEGMAEVMGRILDQEEMQIGAMIGHSMGGYVTLAFAEKYPGRLNAFGLFHSTAFADSEEKKASRRKSIEFIRAHGAAAFLETAVPGLFAEDSRLKMADVISGLVKSGASFSPEALSGYYEAMMQRPDRTDVLKKAHVPVLFVMGKYDTAVPLADGLKQCYLPGKSYIHVLQSSGHMGMLEEMEHSNKLLENFLVENLIHQSRP
ncbi:MAG TPA: alpha/beta fold hydrolase [Chitinophagaceae bacterium]|nr:alpha/beta fold hydrolase [Chitinophagaceae bacterium]